MRKQRYGRNEEWTDWWRTELNSQNRLAEPWAQKSVNIMYLISIFYSSLFITMSQFCLKLGLDFFHFKFDKRNKFQQKQKQKNSNFWRQAKHEHPYKHIYWFTICFWKIKTVFFNKLIKINKIELIRWTKFLHKFNGSEISLIFYTCDRLISIKLS